MRQSDISGFQGQRIIFIVHADGAEIQIVHLFFRFEQCGLTQ